MGDIDRSTAIQALRDPEAGVIVLGPDGTARTAHHPQDVDAGMNDRDASIMVVSGRGWRRYAHLMSEQHRHVEDREPEPHREPDGPPPDFEPAGREPPADRGPPRRPQRRPLRDDLPPWPPEDDDDAEGED